MHFDRSRSLSERVKKLQTVTVKTRSVGVTPIFYFNIFKDLFDSVENNKILIVFTELDFTTRIIMRIQWVELRMDRI